MSYRIIYHDNSDGTSTLQYKGDAQGLVDHCAEYARGMRELTRREREKAALGMGMRKVLSVDPVVAMDVAQKRGMDWFNPELWEEFKDRDYAKFRTTDDKRLFQRKKIKRIVTL